MVGGGCQPLNGLIARLFTLWKKIVGPKLSDFFQQHFLGSGYAKVIQMSRNSNRDFFDFSELELYMVN